ncbi:MAG: hypothetical protein LBT09_08275 [Planctomycetaceae bacterium]|jgi:hypothetical protein|nr:hypothetical protein [Planctomycetaceae bacterium]
MNFLLFVGDLSCPELASTDTPFEQRSTGATFIIGKSNKKSNYSVVLRKFSFLPVRAFISIENLCNRNQISP